MTTRAITLPLALCALAGSAWAAGGESITISADAVYTGAGDTLRGGSVTFGDKITAVASGGSSDFKVGAITPGMIELSARVTDSRSVEQTNEIQPGMSVTLAIDPFDRDFDRYAASGVTTVLVSPADWNVIGGLSLAMKTAGSADLEARTVASDVVLRGAIGSQPSSGNHPAFGRPTDFFSRRPTTRMGVEWEWRKACYDTLAAEKNGSMAFPGSDQLLRALDGELPVFVQAWTTQDIRTAVFLKEEMAGQGKPNMRLIIDAGAEAWKEPHLLSRTGTPVVLPPFPVDGRTSENSFMAWESARALLDAGIPVALSSHNARAADSRLALQAAYAMRGGLTREEAVAAVSSAPAHMIGIEDRVGSLEVGKDADLVLWSGEPFDLTSRIVGVVVNGELVVDPRQSEESGQ